MRIVLLICLVLSAAGQVSALEAWFESATVKIRQNASVQTQPSWTIRSAKNEFEPFQLALKSDAALSQMDADISDFTGPGGTISKDNVTIFLEKYVNVSTISTTEGQYGEWPDILCPKVDAYYHEQRNFFPFSIGAGRIQPLWFDVFVPSNTVAGTYYSTVTVTQNGSTVFEGSVTLKVWDFSLPPTSNYKTAFGLSSSNPGYGHYGDIWTNPGTQPAPLNAVIQLHALYMKAGLRHRITVSPYPLSISGFNGSAYTTASNTYFMQSINSAGTGVEYGAAQQNTLGADFGTIYRKYVTASTCTSVSPVYTQPPADLLNEISVRASTIYDLLTPAQRSIYSVLPIDEPGGGEVGCGGLNATLDYNSTRGMAQQIRNSGQKVRVTKGRRAELLNAQGQNDLIDVWVSYFGSIVGRDWSMNPVNNRPLYDQDIANGGELWWYQSCMNHGCAIIGGAAYNGFPQQMLDYQSIYTRIFPWMSFKYDVTGELYWEVVGGYYLGPTGSNTGDPWYTLFCNRYYGNGDGTFFYPGVPDATAAGLPNGQRGLHTPSIGGTKHIPIESIRLKMIREGIEDYDYLYKLEQLGGEAYAKSQTDTLVTTTYNFNHDPLALYAAREAVANQILALTNSVPPASPKGFRIK